MNIVNEKVEHIKFGLGIITEAEDCKIWVRFQNEIEEKLFLYPEVFENFLKAVNSTVKEYVLEELCKKQEQIEMQQKEREDAELEEKMLKLVSLEKKSVVRSNKKKCRNQL